MLFYTFLGSVRDTDLGSTISSEIDTKKTCHMEFIYKPV